MRLLLMIVVVVLGSSAVAAPPDPKVVASAKTLISGYEKVPNAGDWARIGSPEEVSAALMALAQTERTLMSARATASLGFFARSDVRVFLEARLDDRALHPSLRGKAAIALAGAFGDDAAEVIAPLFTAAEPELREDAIRAYRRMLGPAAERFLLARASREPDRRLADLMLTASGAIVSERLRLSTLNALDARVLGLPAIADPGPVRR